MNVEPLNPQATLFGKSRCRLHMAIDKVSHYAKKSQLVGGSMEHMDRRAEKEKKKRKDGYYCLGTDEL